jgi:hypothetical protein
MKPAAIRRELANLRQTVRDEAALLPALPPADDAGELARELAGAFGRVVEDYREFFKLSPEEARARACEGGEAQPEHLDRILTGPPDQVSWFDLDTLARHDPEKARERWQQVKRAARLEVRDGHRAARALEGSDARTGGGCWERARFLAVRAELADAWRPRDALEQQLIDQLAQWQTLLWQWQETVRGYMQLASLGVKQALREGGPGDLPRVSLAEALDQAEAMVERCHRLYLRTLGALQDQRRQAPPVVVRGARQVNIAGQQVNLAR